MTTKYDRMAKHFLHEMGVRAFHWIGPEEGAIVEMKPFTPAQQRNFERAVARELERQRRELVEAKIIPDSPLPPRLQGLVDEQAEETRATAEERMKTIEETVGGNAALMRVVVREKTESTSVA